MSLFARSISLRSILMTGLFAGLVSVALAVPPTFTFTTLSYPGAPQTDATAINNVGQIVGYYSDPGFPGVYRGFLYGGGSFSTFDEPLTTDGTYPTAINDSGQIVGYYVDGTGTHGFLYSGGVFTTLDDPSVQYTMDETVPRGINDSGQIVGYYPDNSGNHGFLYMDGAYTALTAPAPETLDTFAYGINNSGPNRRPLHRE